jgi:hypothetical protein
MAKRLRKILIPNIRRDQFNTAMKELCEYLEAEFMMPKDDEDTYEMAKDLIAIVLFASQDEFED